MCSSMPRLSLSVAPDRAIVIRQPSDLYFVVTEVFTTFELERVYRCTFLGLFSPERVRPLLSKHPLDGGVTCEGL